jgi:long-chain fatty acid transport protein
MVIRRKEVVAGLSGIVAMAALTSPAVAGGLYLAEIGTRDAGFASAGWAARADDAGTIATNPAGLARLTQPELIVGLQPLYADVQFDPDARP